MRNDNSADMARQLCETIILARERQSPVYISAGGSKRQMIGRHCDAQLLDVSAHRGIIDYQPAELVLTARAGTPLGELQNALELHGQTLSFEPPRFDGTATLGGTLACNLSGPARPWGGSIRDMVLGVKLINGRGELLNFGGRVMKNVAGYDLSRLQAGALGTLGILSEISLKVLPGPEHTLHLSYEMTAQQAVETMNQRAGEPKPLTGAFWLDGRLHLRLAGTASAVEHTAGLWGGDRSAEQDHMWQDLRDMALPFFAGPEPLWRLSLKGTTPVEPSLEPGLIDWCGAQRWVRGNHDLGAIKNIARAGQGHFTLFRGGDRCGETRSPLTDVEQRLQQRLKHAFDPDGILNPGRLYSWL